VISTLLKCLTYENAATAEEMKRSRFPHAREARKEGGQ